MKIDQFTKARLSSNIMYFNTDEIIDNQLIDPFVKKSELNEVSVIYSPNKDVSLSVNGQFARGEINANPMTNWYGIETGIVYTQTAGVTEPDGIKSTIFSKSEHCYYLGTTEGLYRTYNDNFSNCERILSAKITVNSSSTAESIEKMSHVTNITEIGPGLYLISVTGKTSSQVSYMVYNSFLNNLMCEPVSSGNAGWRIANRLVYNDDMYAIVAFTSTNEASIIDIVTVDKLNKIISVTNVLTNGSGTDILGKQKSTHFMEELGDKMFFSHHYSDNPTQQKYKGIDYTDLSNITERVAVWNADTVKTVSELSTSRVYQIRTIKDTLYVCCGLSGTDSLGLSKITIDNNSNIICTSLTSDQYLSNFTNAKDIYYSEKAKKWSFCLNDTVYIAEESDDGSWCELTSTGYQVSAEVYPRFNEYSNLITIYARDYPYEIEDPQDSTQTITVIPPETMLESPITNGGLIATLNDITTKNIRVDGIVLEADKNGFVDIDIKQTIKESFVVVDEIPSIMEDGKIYFVKKQD